MKRILRRLAARLLTGSPAHYTGLALDLAAFAIAYWRRRLTGRGFEA